MARPHRRSGVLQLVTGCDAGHEAWHLLLVDRLKYPIFKQVMGTACVNMADYGSVICSGWGKPPPFTELEVIAEQYGVL